MKTMFDPELLKIAEEIDTHGGRCYLVGGAVRDLVMGLKPKDFDIEVFGLTPAQIENLVKRFGRVQADVGKSFSVIKLKTRSHEYDLALPRRETKMGRGYTGFEVEIDPYMTPEEAASRRDFTFNALMYDFETEQVLDFFGGMNDISQGILRHVSSAFAEDPLRVLRGFQFAARFNMRVDEETAEFCRSLKKEYDTFPTERIWGEWYKWATKGIVPSAGLQFLIDTGWIDLYPQIKALIGTPQDPTWHPEGDVFVHTCHVVDAANVIAKRVGLKNYDRAMLMFACLCHDFGKPEATVFDGGRWRSPKHGHTGVEPALIFLEHIGAPKAVVAKIPTLIQEHLSYLNVKNTRALRNLANRLKPATIRELTWVIEADHSGRPPLPKQLPEQAQAVLQMAVEDGIVDHPPIPLVTGKMLLHYGVQPGPRVGELMRQAYQLQLNAQINNSQQAEEWVQEQVNPSLLTGKILIQHGIVKPGPLMGEVLKAAKQAQQAGEFSSLQGALDWARNYLA